MRENSPPILYGHFHFSSITGIAVQVDAAPAMAPSLHINDTITNDIENQSVGERVSDTQAPAGADGNSFENGKMAAWTATESMHLGKQKGRKAGICRANVGNRGDKLEGRHCQKKRRKPCLRTRGASKLIYGLVDGANLHGV